MSPPYRAGSGQWIRNRSTYSRPSALSVSSKAWRASSGSCASLLSLLVTKTSPRSRPDRAMASPTSASLPYISAVSMCRYPAPSAVPTAAAVSLGSIRKTPKPSCGIVWPLFSVMSGMEVTEGTLLSWIADADLSPLPRSGRATHGAVAQAVGEQRDHALAVGGSLARHRHAQQGDGVQQVARADAGP